MTELDWYKNSTESYTALVFGEVFKNRPPVTNNILFGQKAYEAFQVYVYLDALLITRNDPSYVDWSPLFCALYAGLIATEAKQVVELGSTLFATIDKLNKLAKLANGPILDLEFIGVEPSRFFCETAEALHPTSRIKHVSTLSDAPIGYSVNRCYQATSYAFKSTTELVDYCATATFGSQGLWCSVDGTTKNVSILGKSLTLFSVPEFVDSMRERGFTVEFIANDRATRLKDFEYYELWLIYHKMSLEQEKVFREWLAKLAAITGENAKLYQDFASVPVGVRKDAGFEGIDPSGIFNFTSPEAVRRFGELVGPLKESSKQSSIFQRAKAAIKNFLPC